jgi:hypothetical protein
MYYIFRNITNVLFGANDIRRFILGFKENFRTLKKNTSIVLILIEPLEPFLGPDIIFHNFVSPAPYC